MSDKHVHDCTGPDMRCPCGYVFTTPRYALSFDVYDNNVKRTIVEDCFNCDDLTTIVSALEEAIEKLEQQ